MLNSTNSTRIVLFILCVISFQMLSDAQPLSTIQNGTPGSGKWMGNNGLAPWVLGRVKMQILRWQLNYGVFLVLNRVRLLEFYVNLFIFPKRFNIQTLQAKPESQNARQLSFRRFSFSDALNLKFIPR